MAETTGLGPVSMEENQRSTVYGSVTLAAPESDSIVGRRSIRHIAGLLLSFSMVAAAAVMVVAVNRSEDAPQSVVDVDAGELSKFYVKPGDDLAGPVDYYTKTAVGCQCAFDVTSEDCACCRNGGQQCPSDNRHRCVEAGKMDTCSSAEVKAFKPGYTWSVKQTELDAEGWGQCVAACGTSVRYRHIACIREDGTVVDDQLCNDDSRPVETATCQSVETCDTYWHAADWSACNPACGCSTQERVVQCRYSVLETPVDDELCTLEMPALRQQCSDYSLCNYEWATTCSETNDCLWQGCTAQCGVGTETRTVQCRRSDGEECDGTPINTVVDQGAVQADWPNNHCSEEKPKEERECWQADSSCPYFWVASEWNACNAACGEWGEQQRTVVCQRSGAGGLFEDVDASYCGDAEPADSQECQAFTTCSYSWKANDWAICREGCGSTPTERAVYCEREDGVAVPDAFCEASYEREQATGVSTGLYKIRVGEEWLQAGMSGPLYLTGRQSDATEFVLSSQDDGTFRVAVLEYDGLLRAKASSGKVYITGAVEDEACDFTVAQNGDGSYSMQTQDAAPFFVAVAASDDGSSREVKLVQNESEGETNFVLYRQHEMLDWQLIAAMGTDDTWKYTSPLWTNGETLNENDDTAPNRKLGTFNTAKFDQIKVCVGESASNCMMHEFPYVWESAAQLFSAGFIKQADFQRKDFDRVFTAEPSDCDMQLPGFNVNGNRGAFGGNKARWGYLNNLPGQDCMSDDGDDSDGAIGIGLEGETPESQKERGEASMLDAKGAGWTPFFDAKAGTGGTASSAWLYVADSTADGAGMCAGLDLMDVEVVDDESSERYDTPGEDWMAQCGGYGESSSPLGPFFGKVTWFKGIGSGGQEETFTYKLSFKQPTSISSISVSGSGFSQTKWQLLNENMQVISSKTVGDSLCPACKGCSVNVPGAVSTGTVFFLRETNANPKGRMRNGICVRTESNIEIVPASCEASTEFSYDQNCAMAFDNDMETNWASFNEPVGNTITAVFSAPTMVSEIVYAARVNEDGEILSSKDVTLDFQANGRVVQHKLTLANVAGPQTFKVRPTLAQQVSITAGTTYVEGDTGAQEIKFYSHEGGLVYDGGFELPYSNSWQTLGPGSNMAWDVPKGDVDIGRFEQHVGVHVEGHQLIDLCGTQAGAVSQQLGLRAGQYYMLKFAVSGNFHFLPEKKETTIWWGDTKLSDITFDTKGFTVDTMTWKYYAFTVLAETDAVELKFESVTDSAGCMLLDDVSLVFAGKPAQRRTCESAATCPCGWSELQDWDEIACDNTCGNGQKTRALTCSVHAPLAPVHGNTCKEARCPVLPDAELSQDCTSFAECKFSWRAESWDKVSKTQCAASCGPSTSTREVECRRVKTAKGSKKPVDVSAAPPELCNTDGKRFMDSFAVEKPQAEAPCNDYSLCIYKIQCNPWQTCQADCGKSKQERECWCWRSDGALDVPMSECDAYGVTQEPTEKPCENFDACSYMWHVETGRTPFGAGVCSDPSYQLSSKRSEDVDACEASCEASKKGCAFYSFNSLHGKCGLWSECEVLSEVEPGFKTYKMTSASEKKAPQWRVLSNSPIGGCWGVCELELFADKGCTQQLDGKPISSGARGDDTEAALAFDRDDWCGNKVSWGQWSGPCGVEDDKTPAGQHWVGLDFGEKEQLVQCIRIKQSGDGTPTSLKVQSFDGHSWFDRWTMDGVKADTEFQTSSATTAKCRAEQAELAACQGSLGDAGCDVDADCMSGLSCGMGDGLYFYGEEKANVCTDGRKMSLDFLGDGTNYARFNDATQALDTEFAVNMWIKPLSESAEGRLVSKPRADGGAGWNINIDNGQVEFVGVGDPVKFWSSGKAGVDVDRWQMVTATFSQDARKLYVDGQLVATDPAAATTAMTTASEDSPILIGREFLSDYQGGRPLKYVRVARVAVWSKAIIAEEVASLKAGMSPDEIKAQYLVGSWESATDFESNNADLNLVYSVPIDTSEDFPGLRPTVGTPDDAGVMEKL